MNSTSNRNIQSTDCLLLIVKKFWNVDAILNAYHFLVWVLPDFCNKLLYYYMQTESFY